MKKGFTLLEILLVIAAIGILAAIVIVAINPNRQLAQTRDAQRQTDVNTLYKGLEQYLIDEGSYPAEITPVYQDICPEGVTLDCADLSVLVPNYLASIPEDPSGTSYQVGIDTVSNKVSLLAAGEIQSEIVINPIQIVTSGGDVTVFEDGGTWYRVHTFLASETFSVLTPLEVEYLIVAGGGGGGSGRGGGGGAGGFLTGSTNIAAGDLSIVVGNGGAAQTNGQNSTALGLTAIGGGAGGTHLSANNGSNGGSGGGGAINYSTVIPQGGAGTVGQGFNGAPGGSNTNDNPRNTGGGGGASEVGTRGVGTTVRPDGGDGLTLSISGTSVVYAGGGGGAFGGIDRSSAGFGFGGSGGGGNGGDDSTPATSGQDGLGGGGGGGYISGASGGSGVVIIRYEI